MSESQLSWQSLLTTIGSFLGYIVLGAELIIHWSDLKLRIMTPNFVLSVSPPHPEKDNGEDVIDVNIIVENKRTWKRWFVGDAHKCEGFLSIKKHETKNWNNYDVKDTTPLKWEERKASKIDIPANFFATHLQSFRYFPKSKKLIIRVDEPKTRKGTYPSKISYEGLVDILVGVSSNEGKTKKWLLGVRFPSQIANCENLPKFTNDC